MVLEAGDLRSGPGKDPLLGCRLLFVSSHDRRRHGTSLALFCKGMNGIHGGLCPHDLNHLRKGPPTTPPQWAFGFQQEI